MTYPLTSLPLSLPSHLPPFLSFLSVTALTLDAIYERPMTGLGSGVIRKDKDKSKDKENDRDREGGMPSLSSSSSSMNHFDEDNNSSDDPLITTSSSSSGGNGNSSGNSNNSSSSVFFVPSALAVLRQCGGQEALLHAFPTALLENNVLATDQVTITSSPNIHTHTRTHLKHTLLTLSIWQSFWRSSFGPIPV